MQKLPKTSENDRNGQTCKKSSETFKIPATTQPHNIPKQQKTYKNTGNVHFYKNVNNRPKRSEKIPTATEPQASATATVGAAALPKFDSSFKCLLGPTIATD